ncbi:hypothetical protein G6O69_25480 [Pseudenhygromyxa sp. WMMC2535]|uniref:hypothetical protein n=1 Tax=Pseudenhygromyxa sp. WMMC2535 TaxID=2712867 RepID=UPI00155775A5|nr:hypothetical protein [Pseudenhygromyxa sp. WMMC2535]NVB41216.1 hypothetical protein [Pseudenhygromyxa sp. WMMC2535]
MLAIEFNTRRSTVLALSLGLVACYHSLDEDAAEGAGETGSDEAGDSEPQAGLVTIDGSVELHASCVALESGERLASLAPEGHLWLSPAAGASASYRVVSPDGSVEQVELDHATEQLQAWDESRVVYLAEDQLWQAEIDDSLTEPLYWPETLDAPTGFCGDPSIDGDGFVLAGDALIQRDAGLWWRWVTPEGEDFGPVSALAGAYGACVDRQGALWLRDALGQTWRVSADEVREVSALADAEQLTFDASFGVAGLVDGQLIFGEVGAWQAPSFPTQPDAEADAAGEPAQLSAIASSAGRLWVAGDFGLLRFDGEGWREVLVDGEALEPNLGPTQLHADADGLWIERGAELCRLEAEGALSFEGLRPLQRLNEAELSLRVLGSLDASALALYVDDALVASLEGGALPWEVDDLELGEQGWHRVELLADGELTRAVDVELRLPTVGTWLDDIQPLSELHCTATAGCHDVDAGDYRPVLTEYEGWVEAADAIRARVGLTGDMPPPASRLASWDAEEVALILTWIEAGMPIGME